MDDDRTSAIQDVRNYAAAFVHGRDASSDPMKEVCFPLSGLFYRVLTDLEILPQADIERLLCEQGQ